MRSADVSPATEEDRRAEFQEAAAGLYGRTEPNLAEIVHRVREAMERDLRDRQRRLTEHLGRVLK